MFGDRCQGMCPMCGARIGRNMAATATRPDKEHSVSLIQVKVIEGVFTAPQKQEIVERLTDTMVGIEGESMRQRTWCVLEEVASGERGIGGQTLTPDDFKAL